MVVRWKDRSLEIVGNTVESHHLQSRLGKFLAFASCDTVKSLLLLVDSEHTEYHRNVAIGVEL